MYLLNKYTNWYNNIITHAQLRVNVCKYVEKHHILPKSLGGTNDSSNLVKLTAKEHFICHLLLVRMTEDTNKLKMIRAAWLMASAKNKHQKRQKITSRTYKLLKEQLSTATKGIPKSEEHKKKLSKPKSAEHKKKLSEARKGKTGYKHSAETRKKISISNSGKKMPPKTEEWSTAHSEKLRGRKQTIDHIEKRAAARIGKKHSEETKQKIKEARAKQIITKETRLKMSESHKKKIK